MVAKICFVITPIGDPDSDTRNRSIVDAEQLTLGVNTDRGAINLAW